MDDLRDFKCSNNGVMSQRMWGILFKASAYRNNLTLRDGYGSIINPSEELKLKTIQLADAELEFERIRRESYPREVSRLSCLWLSDRSPSVDQRIYEMLGADAYLLDVEVVGYLNHSEADSRWFDRYLSSPNENFIHSYWSLLSESSNPSIEILLDGAIRCINDDQVAYIQDHGNLGK